MQSLLSVVLVLMGGYSILVLYMYVNQGRLLYLPELPTRELVATPEDGGMAYESLELVTEDGIALHGWWVPGASASRWRRPSPLSISATTTSRSMS